MALVEAANSIGGGNYAAARHPHKANGRAGAIRFARRRLSQALSAAGAFQCISTYIGTAPVSTNPSR